MAAAAVSRNKRPFDDFQEGEQGLQPDAKKQQFSSSFLSQNTSLAPVIPSSPSNGIAGSQVYDDSDLDDTLLDFSDGESSDSSVTLEEEDRLLADDPETDTSYGLRVKEVGSGFAVASLRCAPHWSVPKVLSTSLEPLPLTDHSEPSSSGLSHSSAPLNPGRGSNANVDSQNQTGLSCTPDGLGLQDVMSVEAGSSNLKKGDSGSGIVDKEGTHMVGEESSVVSQLMAKCEFARVVTDRSSKGQAFIEQSKVGGESASDPPCETQEESDSAAEIATEHPITAPNMDPSTEEPENPSPEEPEDPSPDDSRRRIFIPEELLQRSKEKYVRDVLAHAQHRSIIGPTNELRKLMTKVASEYHFSEPSYRHPTDLTVRNYAQRTNTGIQKYSLEKWVNLNRRHFRRFADIPAKFERSPIPSR